MPNKILPELENKDYIHDLKTNYDISFCPIDAASELVEFIDLYWRKNHIFVLSRELLDWQHLDKHNNRYNFVIARSKQTKQIHSILGFVPTSQFDMNIPDMQVWPCIWKVREDVKVKGLGVSLYHFLVNNIDIETIAILGISEIALSIYKKWNFTTGKISHYFMPNKAVSDFKLIGNTDGLTYDKSKSIDGDFSVESWTLSDYNSLKTGFFSDISKYKSKDYYINRFYKHPIYTYTVYSLKAKDDVKIVLFMREVTANGAKALRIVDYIGDLSYLPGNYDNLQLLMSKHNAEYIDWVSVGLNYKHLSEAGFIDKSSTNLIVPNYFEPFLLENVDLDFAFKSTDESQVIVFHKGDADQDRPNILDNA